MLLLLLLMMMIILKPRHSVHCWFSFTYPFPTLRTLSPHSAITPLSPSPSPSDQWLADGSPAATDDCPTPDSQKFVRIVRNVAFAADRTAPLCAPRQITADSLPDHRENLTRHQKLCGVKNGWNCICCSKLLSVLPPAASQLGGWRFLVSHLAQYTGCGKNVYHLL
jgi:hypothetical protein